MMSLGGEAIINIVRGFSLVELEALERICQEHQKHQTSLIWESLSTYAEELNKKIPSLKINIDNDLGVWYTFVEDPCPLDREHHEHYISLDESVIEVGNHFDCSKCRVYIKLDGTNTGCARDGCHQFDEILNNVSLMTELRLLSTKIDPDLRDKYQKLTKIRL